MVTSENGRLRETLKDISHSSNTQKAAPRRNYPYKTGQLLVGSNCRKARLIRDCKGFPEEPEEAVKSPSLEEEVG